MSNINLCDCEENWMEIKYKNNLLLLSSKGRIYSYYWKKFVGNCKNNGYIRNGSVGFFHRLVAKYFINNGKDFNLVIDHINTIKNHNCICNLKICTPKENQNNPLTMKKFKNLNNAKGCKRSEEFKKNISKIHKNKILKQQTKNKISETIKNLPKIYKCYFCNSKSMNINSYNNWHGNGKCLFK